MRPASAKKQRHLIIGFGEVGKGLYEVLRARYPVAVRDKKKGPEGRFEVLHLAYPWSASFVRDARAYVRRYHPSIVIVHSTVPVGTTRRISPRAVHSPIRGTHPRLAKSIKTFVKYFGGSRAKSAASLFSRLGIPIHIVPKPETTELLKILDTTYYGYNIMFVKEVYRLCRSLGLNFDEVYAHPNRSYNEGYRKLGKPHVIRPVLEHVPGAIGGHCVIANTHLLDDWLTRTLRSRNRKYRK